MAVAFEKLVLASGISGPGVASPPAALRQRAGNDSSLSGGEPLLHDDVPTFPPPRRPGLIATYAPKAAILLVIVAATARSEEHTSELQSLMRISYAVFCLKTTQQIDTKTTDD